MAAAGAIHEAAHRADRAQPRARGTPLLPLSEFFELILKAVAREYSPGASVAPAEVVSFGWRPTVRGPPRLSSAAPAFFHGTYPDARLPAATAGFGDRRRCRTWRPHRRAQPRVRFLSAVQSFGPGCGGDGLSSALETGSRCLRNSPSTAATPSCCRSRRWPTGRDHGPVRHARGRDRTAASVESTPRAGTASCSLVGLALSLRPIFARPACRHHASPRKGAQFHRRRAMPIFSTEPASAEGKRWNLMAASWLIRKPG